MLSTPGDIARDTTARARFDSSLAALTRASIASRSAEPAPPPSPIAVDGMGDLRAEFRSSLFLLVGLFAPLLALLALTR
jgi:hypothetical protein